jgi:hypothetical protein
MIRKNSSDLDKILVYQSSYQMTLLVINLLLFFYLRSFMHFLTGVCAIIGGIFTGKNRFTFIAIQSWSSDQNGPLSFHCFENLTVLRAIQLPNVLTHIFLNFPILTPVLFLNPSGWSRWFVNLSFLESLKRKNRTWKSWIIEWHHVGSGCIKVR